MNANCVPTLTRKKSVVLHSYADWEKKLFHPTNDTWSVKDSRSMSQRVGTTVLWFADKNEEPNFPIAFLFRAIFMSRLNCDRIHFFKCMFIWLMLTLARTNIISSRFWCVRHTLTFMCLFSFSTFDLFYSSKLLGIWFIVDLKNGALSLANTSWSSDWAAKRHLRLDLTSFNRFRCAHCLQWTSRYWFPLHQTIRYVRMM